MFINPSLPTKLRMDPEQAFLHNDEVQVGEVCLFRSAQAKLIDGGGEIVS